MRILIVVARDHRNPTSAGGDQHLTLIAQELAGQGHEVTLWCSRHPTTTSEERYGGIRVLRLAPLPFLAPLVWARFLIGAARSYDLVIEDLVGGARAPFGAALLARRPHAGMWFQDNRPLFRETYSRPVAALAAAMQSALLLIYRRGWALVPSEATRGWVVAQGMDASKVMVVPRRERVPVPASGVPSFDRRRNRIVCIGNLRPLKRLHESIELLARLRPDLPNAELYLIGRRSDPEYLRRLELRARAPDVSGSVEIRPDATESEKHAILTEAKVLTLHSPVEGFGWTVVEAGAFGVPAVGNVGVPADVIEEGRNGYRLPVGDEVGYAAAVRRILTDRTEWEHLSEGAQAVARRYSEAAPDPGLDAFVRAIVPARMPR